MKVELNRDDLVSLVNGISPHYNIMETPIIQKCGYYIEGLGDKWVWFHTFDDKLTEQQLWDLYILCRDSWN